MIFNDAEGGRHAEAATVNLRRKERLKNPLQRFVIHPDASVDNADVNISARLGRHCGREGGRIDQGLSGGDGDKASLRQRLQSVGDDSLHGHFDLCDIACRNADVVLQLLDDLNVGAGRQGLGEDDLVYHIVDGKRPGLIFSSFGISEQLIREPAHPVGRCFQGSQKFLRFRMVVPVHLQHFKTAVNDRQRVVELVRDAARQRRNGLNLSHILHFHFHNFFFLLHGHAFGNIVNGTEKPCP